MRCLDFKRILVLYADVTEHDYKVIESGKRESLREHVNSWTRADAESRIHDVLDDAKLGTVQHIVDGEGFFEVKYVSSDKKENATSILSRSGPID